MVNDDKRREVTAELREMSDWDDEVDCTDFGKRVVNLLWRVRGCDGTEGAFYAALADLIEPSIPVDPGEAGLACVDAFIREHTEKPVDRDALLAVADELSEVRCDKRGELSITYGDLQGLARIIREALGVSDD